MEEEKNNNVENQIPNNVKTKNKALIIMGLVIFVLVVVIIVLLFVMGTGDKNSNNNEQKAENNEPSTPENNNIKEELTINENLKIDNNILTVFKTNSDAGQILVVIDKDGNQRYDDIDVSLYSDRFILDNDKLYYVDNNYYLNRYDFNSKENYNYNITVDSSAYRMFFINNKVVVCGNNIAIYDVSKPNIVKKYDINDKVSNVIIAYDENDNNLYFTTYYDDNHEHRLKKLNLSNYSVEDTGIKGTIRYSFDNYFVYAPADESNWHIYNFKTKEDKIIEEKNPILAVNSIDDYYYTVDTSNNMTKSFSKIIHKKGTENNTLYEEKEENYFLEYIGKSGKYVILKEYEADYSNCSNGDDVCGPVNKNIKYYLLNIKNHEYKEIKGDINNYDINDYMIW